MAEEEKKKSTKKKKKSGLNAEFHLGGISTLNVALSIRHLSLMLKSGLSLGEAVSVLGEQSTDPRLKDIYAEIAQKIQEGRSLSDSMQDYPKAFTKIVVSIVSIGEQGATLEQNLIFLADYLKKAHELGKKIKGALIYPGIVMTLTVIEMLGVIFFILPKLEELFATFDNVPSFTRAIMSGSKFIRTNSLFIAAGIIAIIVLFNLFLRTKPGRKMMDFLAINFPIIKNLNKKGLIATFSRTLGILLQSGIPIAKALEIASDTISNSYYKNALMDVQKSVKEGKTMSDSLSKYTKYFPGTYVKMIEVGENTGTLEENLNYLYDYYAEEVDDMTNNLTTLLEPILLIFIGGMIALLAIIIIGPIYQFTGSINGGQ